MGFQHMTPEKRAAVQAKGRKAWAEKRPPRREPMAPGRSIAQQMLAQYKRRLLKGEQEGW